MTTTSTATKPTKKKATATKPTKKKATDKKTKLKDNLVLVKFMLNFFGVSNFEELRDSLKMTLETCAEDGKSYFFHALSGLTNLSIDSEDFIKYDQNIKNYLNHINNKRTEKKIQLKYFQYLTVLFTEIFLDKFFNNNTAFLNELNQFVKKENAQNNTKFPNFSKNDLTKLAYWMATGSGKTHIMHINFLQFWHYNKKSIDNIILITPNEALSQQHLNELKKANIRAKTFDETHREKDTIQIIEITKFKEIKTGKGVSVEVDSFEGNNLVFVDEGHKGFSGETWKRHRDKISELGFTFEYSATFEEAIDPKNDNLMDEYSKAIIMDYSYHYFYEDGFGKEFTVLNTKSPKWGKTIQDLILLTNLLSYYQQIKFYKENLDAIKKDNFSFSKPLWLFVGHSVVGKVSLVDKPDTVTLSDLQLVMTFFSEFLSKKQYFVNQIDEIISGRRTLQEPTGKIKLSDRFGYIKNKKPEKLYDDILLLVFNSKTQGKLQLSTITAGDGEICLKVMNEEKYFALVYIGDVPAFKKKLGKPKDLVFRNDEFASSYFATIDDEGSDINVLMGAKKFIEGWNSYRVSSMGLLNVGQNHGPQIIQLFGRGVRLRGYKNIMKRSSKIDKKFLDPQKLKWDPTYLETLNIFGIKANYIDTFQRELKAREGISETKQIPLETKPDKELLKNKLFTLKRKDEDEYTEALLLYYNPDIKKIKLDLSTKIQSLSSSLNTGITQAQLPSQNIPVADYLEYFNWDEIYFKIHNFTQQKEFYNLYFGKDILRIIMSQINFEVISDKKFSHDKYSYFEDLEEQCSIILQKYITEFYNQHKRKWVTDNLKYDVLKKEDPNFQSYTITIDEEETALIKKINKQINSGDIYEKNCEGLSIFFDRHLCQPLIIDDKTEKLKSSPTGLNKGEEKFVDDLRTELKNNKQSYGKKKFFLLRNLPLKGVGILAETNNFYPDFILWIKEDNKQNIVFIDPKGLTQSAPSDSTRKIVTYKIFEAIGNNLKDPNVTLTSFIVSVSPLAEIKRLGVVYEGEGGTVLQSQQDFEKNHVVFQKDDPIYVKKILDIVCT